MGEQEGPKESKTGSLAAREREHIVTCCLEEATTLSVAKGTLGSMLDQDHSILELKVFNRYTPGN